MFIGSEEHESFLYWLERVCMRKGGRNKTLRAVIVKRQTSVANEWLAKRLAMGHPAYVSNRVNHLRKSGKDLQLLDKCEPLCKYKDPDPVVVENGADFVFQLKANQPTAVEHAMALAAKLPPFHLRINRS